MWLLKTKVGRIIISTCALLVIAALLFFVIAADSKRIINAYNELGGKPAESKTQFIAKYAILKENTDGKHDGIEFVMNDSANDSSIDVPDEGLDVTPGDDDPDTGEQETGDGGGSEEGVQEGDYVVPYDPDAGDILIDDWLVLHANPSPAMYNLDTRHLSCSEYNGVNWSMGEGDTGTNKYIMGLYSDSTWSRPIINGNTASNGAVNKNGRYWVAIGPAWFNPGIIDSNGYCSSQPGASDWFSDGTGHYFDIVVNYQGSKYYIYSCVGDAKAHTFGPGKGFCQSGLNWNGSENYTNTAGYQPIEWPRTNASVGANLDGKMSFVGLLH